METIWFCLIAVMLAMYVVFDGFDIGAGIVHLYAARTEEERRKVLASIGPVWDGNEVWLLAVGGTLYFAFPKLYASSFSGFYLPLMIVLWLLMLRGLGIELRGHFDNTVWKPFWDVCFAGSSILLAIFFGAALGNVIRGVPLDAEGYFFLPLFTDFGVGPSPGILDWYTLLVGVAALLTLTAHGALWVVLKTDGALQLRSQRLFKIGWLGVAVMTVVLTFITFQIQPHVPHRLAAVPWGAVFPLLAVAGLAGMRVLHAKGDDLKAFLSSCAYIIGMLTSAGFGVYPMVLPAVNGAERSLDIYNASSSAPGLQIGLYWFIPGILLVTAYFVFAYRNMAGKVRLEDGKL